MEYDKEINEAISASRKYENRSAFKKYDFHNFYILKKRGLLDRIIPSSLPRITKERSYQIAKKYTTYSDFMANANKCYRKALHNGWIKEYTWLQKGVYDMEDKRHIVYVYEIKHLNSAYIGRTMRPSIRKYQHMSDKKDTLYKFIIKNKLSDNDIEYKVLNKNLNASDSQYYEKFYIKQYKECGWELINKSKGGSLGSPIVKWDYDTCYKEALKYNNETDFKKQCGVANAKAAKFGWKKDYYWLKKYTPYVNYTYEECCNAATQCNSITTFQKQFSSEYRYSKIHGFLETFSWLYQNARYKDIVEYDLNGKFIREVKNSQIKDKNKRQSVLKCCNNKLSYGYNRIWKFKCDVLDEYGNITPKIDGIKANTTPIVQYNSNGEFIQEFNSIKEAAMAMGCSSSSISDVLRGNKTNLCHGYAWKYKKDVLGISGNILQKIELRQNKKIKRLAQYDKNGNLVNIYNSVAIAYKEYTRSKVEWTLKEKWRKGKRYKDKFRFGSIWIYEDKVLDECGKIKVKIEA